MKRLIPGVAALALLAGAAPASAAGFTASATDSAGDSTMGAGSDIRAVDVAYDQVGTATVSWTLDSTTAGLFREVVMFGARQPDGSCGGGNRLFVFADSNGSYAGWRQFNNDVDIDGPGSPGRTAGISVTQDGTKLTASLNDPAAAGYSYDCARAESADSPADQVVYDDVAAFGTAATQSLATALPGSLVAPQKCQKLSGSGFVRSRTVPGVGKLQFRLRSNATSPPGTPLKLTIAGGNPTSTTWLLDGAAVAGSARALSLKPAVLFKRSDHTVTAGFKGRDGTTTSVPLPFKTLGCSSALTATTARVKGGGVLKLRIDSTSALSRATFVVPSAIKAATTSVKLRLRSASDDKTRTWVYKVRNGRIFTPPGAPNFRPGTGGVTFDKLPAQTGILRVDITTTTKPLRRTTLQASATIGGKTTRLKATTD